MTNPLDGGHSSGSGNFGRELAIGEQRTWHARDKDTGAITKTFTLTRTDRDYVYDLCDAYNAERSGHAIEQGIEWYVANGALLIGHSFESMRRNNRQIESRNETERARFIRQQLEHQP